MKVTAPEDFSFVTALERPVDKGETIDVDDDLAAALIIQGWTRATARATKPSAAKAQRATKPSAAKAQRTTTPPEGTDTPSGAPPSDDKEQ